MNEEFKYRKIKNFEIKKAAEVMTKCFYNYPLFDLYFQNPKTKEKLMKAFYQLSIFSRRDYTFVLGNLAFVGCIKHPGEKYQSLFRSLLHPSNFFSCVCLLRRKYIKMMSKVSKEMKEFRDQYYVESRDLFVEALCIDKDAEFKVNIYDIIFNNLPEGQYNLYCETCDKKLQILYRTLGFKVVGEKDILGLKNFALVKPIKK